MKFTYQEYQPSPALENLVDSYWHITVNTPCTPITIQGLLPNGMAELIIHLKPSYTEAVIKGELVPLPEAFIAGIVERPISLQIKEATELFAIRFKPECIFPLFGFSLKDLTNTYVEIHALKSSKLSLLLQGVQRTPDHLVRIAQLESRLTQQLVHYRKLKGDFATAIQLIRHSDQVNTVDQLVQKVGISKRQLQRLFKQNIGMGPKSYFRILRFRKLYQFIQANPKTAWQDIVFHFGYADQSHFIRDFKSFSGKTPKMLLVD